MKLVHSTPDRLLLHLLRTLLEAEAIPHEVRNEALGLAAGDVPPQETWAQLWVEDTDAERAASLVAGALAKESAASLAPDAAWTCVCGEVLDATFDTCWSCAAPKEE